MSCATSSFVWFLRDLQLSKHAAVSHRHDKADSTANFTACITPFRNRDIIELRGYVSSAKVLFAQRVHSVKQTAKSIRKHCPFVMLILVTKPYIFCLVSTANVAFVKVSI